MATIFRKGMDNLSNGTLAGAVVGGIVIWGQNLYDWIVPIIPEAATTFAGEFSVPIIVIGIFTLAGYIIDRK